MSTAASQKYGVPPSGGSVSFALSLSQPVVSVEFAVTILHLDRARVIELIEEGKLLYAFDVRSRNAERPFLRILARSLFEYCTRTADKFKGDLLAVIDSLVPAAQGDPNTASLSHTLAVDSDHLLGLARDGELKTIGKCHRGPNGQARFLRLSVADFLTRRRCL